MKQLEDFEHSKARVLVHCGRALRVARTVVARQQLKELASVVHTSSNAGHTIHLLERSLGQQTYFSINIAVLHLACVVCINDTSVCVNVSHLDSAT